MIDRYYPANLSPSEFSNTPARVIYRRKTGGVITGHETRLDRSSKEPPGSLRSTRSEQHSVQISQAVHQKIHRAIAESPKSPHSKKIRNPRFSPDTDPLVLSRYVKKLNDYLASKSPKRLLLKSRSEIVPQAIADSRVDAENGYLCLYDRAVQAYRKVTFDEIEDVLSLRPPDLYQLLRDPAADLRRSDIAPFSYEARPLGAKNKTHLVNQLIYYFPTAGFTVGDSGESLTVNPELDRFVTLSTDYCSLRVERDGVKQHYLLRTIIPDELTPVQKQSIQKHKMAVVSTTETASRLKPFDVTEFVNPRSNETPQQYARKVIKYADLDNLTRLYRHLLDQAGFELQDYTLKQQLAFAVFYQSQSVESRQKIHYYLQTLGAPFFIAFQACEQQFSNGEEVLHIAEKHGAAALPIFSQLMEIFGLVDKKSNLIANAHTLDQTKFYTAVTNRAASLVKEVAALPVGTDFSDYLQKSKQFDTEVILRGAELAAKSTLARPQVRSTDELNQILQGAQVKVVPAGQLVRNNHPSQLFQASNYPQPKLFSIEDVQMIVDNLRKSYAHLDPDWLAYLTDNITRDLSNPQVTFITIRDKQNKLIGLVKTKPDSAHPGEYYIGTMYVNSEYQKDFGLGDYLQQIAENNLPPNAPYWGSAAVANPAVSRHIEHAGATASEIVFEGDENHRSKELFKLNFRRDARFVSKNTASLSKEKIVAIAEGREQLDKPSPKHTIAIRQITAQPLDQKALVELSQEYFTKGYHLTRFFSAPSPKHRGQSLYLVFEKPSQSAT